MPDFIEETPLRGAGRSWAIWNQTTQGENFAEKWNADPALAGAFFEWHRQISADLAALKAGEGLDHLGKILGRSFGEGPVSSAMEGWPARCRAHVPQVPLRGARGWVGTGTAPANATTVPLNTFFGR